MNLPMEILTEIASYLKVIDLQSFRLTNSRFAMAGISVIARNGLSALDTSSCLKQLQELLESCSSIARGTTQLSVYHGQWPVCLLRHEWETHHLLFGGNDRWNPFKASDTARADKAFVEYTTFIAEEQNRTVSDDISAIARILSLLPNLRTMIISHMQIWSWHPARNAKYRNHQQKIWMTPFIDDGVTLAVQTFLLAFSDKFPNIGSLEVYGNLDPADLYLCPQSLKFPSIHKLHIMSLRIQENKDVIQAFLRAFPNLVELSVAFGEWDSSIPNIVGELSWPHMKKLRFDELRASEGEFFSVFKHHQHTLEDFILGNTMITQGSWRSLFTRMRSLRTETHIMVDGELFGRRSRDTLSIPQAACLTNFMRDHGASPWPFGGS